MLNIHRVLPFLLASLMIASGPLGYAETESSTEESAQTESATSQKPSLPNKVTESPLLNSRFLLFGSGNKRSKTLKWIERRGETDMVAPLIYSLRYLHFDKREEAGRVLERITNRRYGADWFKWMQWQQANPQIKPFKGFDIFLSGLLGGLDVGFKDFVYPGVKHAIRLEEIVWGGVQSKDGIPPIDYPTMITPAQAAYLSPDESVFGVAINGDVRAYPYRIMDWHEMLNDTVGGVPVSLAYCTLCGSGILYNTQMTDGQAHFEFGSSGLLYQSNKLMFDRKTDSLWNQFTGEPVVGELTGSGIKLETLPLVSTTWSKWLAKHPDTKVLNVETGFTRDYRPGKPYGRYFRSASLMFPSLTDDRRLKQKAPVFGLRLSGANQAWPLKAFAGGKVINDQVGVIKVVLVGDQASRTVRAYRRGNREFEKHADHENLVLFSDTEWRITEDALIGPDGQQLSRLPGHLAFWFAWHNYLGGDTLVK